MLRAERPFSLILFGASGHLAKIKIFPALYFLALKKRLPEQYSIVGYARTAMSDEVFRKEFADAVRANVPEVNEKVLSELLTHVAYQAGQYDKVADFETLAAKVEKLEGGDKRVRLAYFSIPPAVFGAVIDNLNKGGLHKHRDGAESDFRCIVEKPVGHDAPSFEELCKKLYSCFDPNEVYILDHYLGKEAVRNIYYLRYANPVIEALLKNTLITNVQITASESAGLEGRAGYFDAVGTFRDMFQSHLIQIAALVCMRVQSDGEAIKAARLDAISKFYLPPAAHLGDIVMQGQYDAGTLGGKAVPAYSAEEGVAKGSRTSTFAAMKLASRSSRWEGVPFFFRSGKRLKSKETRISVEFQESLAMLGKAGGAKRNRLDIILQGEAGMKLHLQTKLGGTEPQFRPLVMEDPLVCMGDCMVEHSLLLLEAINGNQQWFLDPAEVRACWNLIDPLQQYLDEPTTPLALYASGSAGPAEADAFIQKHGFLWS
ncbi:MAG TPA: glucose-6-phosphate dehydrogenase [Candidatus Peribacteria bacterium]|nr:glucose-6-phosphate dehydrogenase [Candidatus Peribacteria bacterium]